SVKLSAQSPPCSRKPSRRCTAARRSRRFSTSQDTTIGGRRANSATARSSAVGSSYTGCCAALRVCQLAGCQELVSVERTAQCYHACFAGEQSMHTVLVLG